MEDYNTRFRDHLENLGGVVTFASADCLHDLRCLQAEHGQQAYGFLAGQ